jgi:hypothetical protein
MTHVAHTVIARQEVGDVDGIVALFAEDCTFMMPILPAPLEGREALRENVEAWPKAVTETERTHPGVRRLLRPRLGHEEERRPEPAAHPAIVRAVGRRDSLNS